MQEIVEATEDLFVVEHFHSFGQYYDHTLMAWYDNFRNNWFKYEHRYGERFFRMWSYYLLSCAGAFRARRNQLWQWVFSKHGMFGGYNALACPAARHSSPAIEAEKVYEHSCL